MTLISFSRPWGCVYVINYVIFTCHKSNIISINEILIVSKTVEKMMMDIFAKCLFLASLTTRTNAETKFLRTEYEKPSRILSEERPVMHTFYHKIEKEHYYHGHKRTGMSDDDDLRLIKAWEEAWQQAGWDTRVIGLKEAMEHPEFDDFDKRFEV